MAFPVFIIGAPWCGACKTLKQNLEIAKLDMNVVDIYDVQLIRHGGNYSELKKTAAYNFWGKLEALEPLPKIYITTPTTSIVASFDERGDYPSLYARVVTVISRIQENSKGFALDLLALPQETPMPISNVHTSKIISKNKKKISSDIDRVNNLLSLQRDSIAYLTLQNDSLQKRFQNFMEDLDSLHMKYPSH
jgi:hypothetical protein